jgi:hypothetical protein
MNQGRGIEVVLAGPIDRSARDEKRADAARPPRAPGSDRFASDLLLHVLAQRLLEVEDWCGSHSEYFLG